MEKLFHRGTVSETVATLLSPAGVAVTPLGVWPCGGRLCARIYPGTRLRLHAEDVYEACIVAAQEPTAFIQALLGTAHLAPATAIRAPCPWPWTPRVEAVVARRNREGDYLLLELEPIHHEPGEPVAYTRLLGAIVEVLVAATRIAFYSRGRRCAQAGENSKAAREALRLAEHLDRGHGASRHARRVLEEAEKTMLVNGCPP